MQKTSKVQRALVVSALVALTVVSIGIPSLSANAGSWRYFTGEAEIHVSKYTGSRTVTGGRTAITSTWFVARVYTVTTGFVPYAGASGVQVTTLSHTTKTSHRSTCSWASGIYVTGVLVLNCDTHY